MVEIILDRNQTTETIPTVDVSPSDFLNILKNDQKLQSVFIDQKFGNGNNSNDWGSSVFSDGNQLYQILPSGNPIDRIDIINAIGEGNIIKFLKQGSINEKVIHNIPKDAGIDTDNLYQISQDYPLLKNLLQSEANLSASKEFGASSAELEKMNNNISVQKNLIAKAPIDDLKLEITQNEEHAKNFLDLYIGGKYYSPSVVGYQQDVLELLKMRSPEERDKLLKAALDKLKDFGQLDKKQSKLYSEIEVREQARALMEKAMASKERKVIYTGGDDTLIVTNPTGNTDIQKRDKNGKITPLYSQNSTPDNLPLKVDWLHDDKKIELTDEQIRKLPQLLADMKKNNTINVTTDGENTTIKVPPLSLDTVYNKINKDEKTR